jgi:uncharacterized membrane protein (DUF485 family)
LTCVKPPRYAACGNTLRARRRASADRLANRNRARTGDAMADASRIDWKAIDEDPRFQDLHRKKTSFLWGLMVFSIVYYFLLPIGAAYFQDLFKIKVWGPVNVGILFALSEFVVAWLIAYYYSRRANAEFDAMAAEIVRDVEKKLGGRA